MYKTYLGGELMKKILSLMLVILAVFCTSVSLVNPDTDIRVQASDDGTKIMLNGEMKSLVAYNIKGNNYFKLRDIANLLKGTQAHFDVMWNDEKGAIEIISQKDYSTNEEMASEKVKNPKIVKSSAKIYRNNKLVLLNAYNINGNTFFKLRDLADVINFGVDWNSADGVIEINTSKDYVHPVYDGDGMALNTEFFSLLNKTKGEIDSILDLYGEGLEGSDFTYNDTAFYITYEYPVSDDSAVLGIVTRLDEVIYNCKDEVTPNELGALFDEYKTGYSEEGNGAHLTANYCGYELVFWRSADGNFKKDGAGVTIYLDTPYVSEKESIPDNSSEGDFVGKYIPDWIDGSYVNIKKNGSEYSAEISLVRAMYLENTVCKVIGKNKMSFSSFDYGEEIAGTMEWSDDYKTMTIRTDSDLWKYIVTESGKLTCHKE